MKCCVSQSSGHRFMFLQLLVSNFRTAPNSSSLVLLIVRLWIPMLTDEHFHNRVSIVTIAAF